MNTSSIRADLARRLLIGLVVAAIVSNAALYLYLRGELTEQYDDALATETRAILTIWQPLDDPARQAAQIARKFDHLRFGGRDGDYLRIVRRDGSTALQVPAMGDSDLAAAHALPLQMRHRHFDLTLPDGRDGRAAVIAFSPHDRADLVSHPDELEYAAILAEDRRELDKTLTHMALGFVVIGGGLSAMSIWLVVNAVRRGLKPLERFSESVGRLDAHSLSFRIAIDGLPAELRPISDRLNDLLGRLDASFARERRFNENIAHELRTPLAELRTMVEVAQRWPPDDAELQRHHANVLDVLGRMTSVVQSLLQITRAKLTDHPLETSPLDVVQCLRSAWVSREPVAASRGVAFAYHGTAALNVDTDATMFASIVNNLMSNAIDYAVPGTTIECVVVDAAPNAVASIRLTNVSAGLSPGDVERFEEPFWRKEAARSDVGHAGLGLALVRDYANVLGIGISYSISEDERLTVEAICHPTSPGRPTGEP